MDWHGSCCREVERSGCDTSSLMCGLYQKERRSRAVLLCDIEQKIV